MPNFPSDYLAIRALESRLATVFGTGSTYATKYDTYNGVDVKMRTDEDSEPENVGKPLLLIEQRSGSESEWSSVSSKYRDVEVSLVSYVTDFSGAQVGASNSVSSDELLARDLVEEFETNYATWRDLGLQDIRFSSGSLEKGDGEVPRKMAHSVMFKYSRS